MAKKKIKTKIMTPKTTKIVYWITTGLLALFILPGIFFLNNAFAIEGTKHLGIPYWFHMELGIAKFIGGLILVLPMISMRLKEWAYVGFGIDFISATIGHLAIDGVVASSFEPVIVLILLVISYACYHKIKGQQLTQ
jgi:hypothetical protein